MKILLSPLSYFFIFFISLSLNSLSQNQAYRQRVNTSGVKTSYRAHFKIPEPVGLVNDFEKLFSETETKKLDSLIMVIHNVTSVQVAIITIDSNMINKDQVEDFTKETFKSWGMQVNGQFNGILIGLSKASKKLRIENGTGVEQVLSDYEIKGIIDNTFIPYLKGDKYYEGTINGLVAIMNKLKVK